MKICLLLLEDRLNDMKPIRALVSVNKDGGLDMEKLFGDH